jgi:hypothetical protein
MNQLALAQKRDIVSISADEMRYGNPTGVSGTGKIEVACVDPAYSALWAVYP